MTIRITTPWASAGLIVACALMFACDVLDRRSAAAHDYLKQRMIDEAKNAFVLTSFEKTNGYDQRLQGLELYVLEWQGDLFAQQEFWKFTNTDLGYWRDFTPAFSPKDFVPPGLTHYRKGSIIRLTGEATLLKTERNWRVEHVAVKAAQVVDPGPKSPFEGVWSDLRVSRGRTYVTIHEDPSGTFLFGESALGPISNHGPFHTWLIANDQKLSGTFVSDHFTTTHGVPFKYHVEFTLGADGKLQYFSNGVGTCGCTNQLSRVK